MNTSSSVWRSASPQESRTPPDTVTLPRGERVRRCFQNAREEFVRIKLMLLRRVRVGRSHSSTVAPLRFYHPAHCTSYSTSENSYSIENIALGSQCPSVDFVERQTIRHSPGGASRRHKLPKLFASRLSTSRTPTNWIGVLISLAITGGQPAHRLELAYLQFRVYGRAWERVFLRSSTRLPVPSIHYPVPRTPPLWLLYG